MKLFLIVLVLVITILSGCRENSYNNYISQAQIIYTTGTMLYPEVWFMSDITGDMQLFEQYKKKNKTCNTRDYGIGGGEGCSNITGYTHNYYFSGFNIRINAYYYSMPNSIDNVGIFTSHINNPFVISDDMIYEQGNDNIPAEYYIQHHFIKSGETKKDILASSPTTLTFFGKNYEKGITTGEVVDYRGQDGAPMMVSYLFQEGKDYYYTIFSTTLGCAPGPCALERHKIEYFTN